MAIGSRKFQKQVSADLLFYCHPSHIVGIVIGARPHPVLFILAFPAVHKGRTAAARHFQAHNSV